MLPLVLAALSLVACGPGERDGRDTGTGGPESGDTSRSTVDTTTALDEMLLSDFIAYAESLSSDSARFAGDADTLIWRRQRGPAARIIAAPGLDSFDPSRLPADSSRYLGKIITPRGSSFPPFGVRGAATFVALVRSGTGGLLGAWISPGDQTVAPTTRVRDVVTYHAAAVCQNTPCQDPSPLQSTFAPDRGTGVAFAALVLRAAQPGQNKKFDRIHAGSPDSVTTQGCWKTSSGWVCTPSKIR